MFRLLLIVVIVLAVALAAVVVALVGSLLWGLLAGSRSRARAESLPPEPSGHDTTPPSSRWRSRGRHATIDRAAEQADRGVRAERRAKAILDRLSPHEYRVYHELFPDKNSSGSLTEIDHVVVSRYGVFVVETKGYYGDVHVVPDASEWKVDRGHQVDSMDNPLRQNAMHVDALAFTLDLEGRSWIRSVVCFADDDTRLRGAPVANVVTAERLVEHIVGTRQVVLNADGVGRITTILDQVDAETPERRARHRQQVGYDSDDFDL